jgi:hypothetical protein
MRKLALGVAAAAIAGTAVAAAPETHVMDVALPGGGTAHIQYQGDVAPKVTFDRSAFSPFSVGWAPMAFPDFGNLDRMFEQMSRAREQIMRQANEMRRRSQMPTASVASYGNMPAGANSVSVVSVSNGGNTCTRTTRVTSQGQGKAPKVVTNVSGNCSAKADPETAPQPKGPVSHT